MTDRPSSLIPPHAEGARELSSLSEGACPDAELASCEAEIAAIQDQFDHLDLHHAEIYTQIKSLQKKLNSLCDRK